MSETTENHDSDTKSDPNLISCEVCMKEVPLSEAHIPETSDYVAHFCGLECYGKWKKQKKHEDNSESPD